MPKVAVKTCRYKNCSHDGKVILVGKDDFVVDGRLYYHADCFKLKQEEEEKKRKETVDMAAIRDMWVKNINPTVIFSDLNRVMYGLLSRGVSSDYLVFVMQYVVKNNCKLNYPSGFRYYVDRQEIKTEYEKKMRKHFAMNQFKANEPQNIEAKQPFPVPRKPGGFEKILTGG